MASMRLRSPLLPLLLCAACGAWCLGGRAFAGGAPRPAGSSLRASAARTGRVPLAALPEAEGLLAASPDASTVLLADSTEAIPLVAFVISVFLGIVGYSVWTAFGPGSADLRDPFEEHED
mmetsp:Transcript_1566/g.4849  ORF Transcript_1566/g.4849 Transcript_1566/m.4849 type:complete len:120 (+) Transcript_1566:110-469(+)